MNLIEILREQYEASTMTTEEIIKVFVDDWEQSQELKDIVTGVAYYDNRNERITDRVKFTYRDDKRITDVDATNERVSHGYMKLIVDDKANYIVGNRPKYTSETENDAELINTVLGDQFADCLIDVVVDASNAGTGWLFPEIKTVDDVQVLKWSNIDPMQVIAIYADDAKTDLVGVIRVYSIEEWVGRQKELVKKAEYWTREDVQHYVYSGGQWIIDMDKSTDGDPLPHIYSRNAAGTITDSDSWGIVPFIPVKNNSKGVPDVFQAKPQIDEYDMTVSDNANMFRELQRILYVLKGYGGESLEEFNTNMRRYGAMKLNADGSVEIHSPEAGSKDATEAHLDRLREDIYTFSQSVFKSPQEYGSNVSGVALEFMYAGLKGKANALERKLQAAYKDIFRIVAKFLEVTGQGTIDPKAATVEFTRSTITNLGESLDAVNTATVSHSLETALSKSPIIPDSVEKELERIAGESRNEFTSDIPPAGEPEVDENPDDETE